MIIMELISSSRRCMGECAGWVLNGINTLHVCDRRKTQNLLWSQNSAGNWPIYSADWAYIVTAETGEWSRMDKIRDTFFASPNYHFSAKLHISTLTIWMLSSSHFKKIINCNDPLEVCKAGVANIGPCIPQPLHAVLTWQFWLEFSSTP